MTLLVRPVYALLSGSMARPSMTRTVAPTGDVVTLAEFKTHARIDGSFEDSSLSAFLAAAVEHLDGPEGMIGQALLTQTWQQRQTRPDADARVYLTLSPFQSLSAISYYDHEHAEQTATLSDFLIIQDGDRRYIKPKPGKSWPALADRPDALGVTYVAGFGDTAADVPERIKQAIRLLAAHWHNEREAVSVAPNMREIPLGVQALVEPFKIRFVA